MSINDPVLEIRAWMSPNTAQASFTAILGTSVPTENIPVWAFHASAIRYIDLYCRIPENYDGGGFTIQLWWGAAVATNGVIWSAAFRAIPSDAEDLDTTTHTYDYNDAAKVTVPSAIGEVVATNILFTDGADSDSVAAGEMCILRIRRVATGDDAAGLAYLHSVAGFETA
jgi:hypothetical protein